MRVLIRRFRTLLRLVGRTIRRFRNSVAQLATAAVMQWLFKRKNYESVVRIGQRAEARFGIHANSEAIRAQAYLQMGQVETSLLHAGQAVKLNSMSLERRAALLGIMGRVNETDRRWHVSVSPKYLAPQTREPKSVLYLAKESLPWQNNGYCTRSHETLLAIRTAGYHPVAVTLPGYPEKQKDITSSTVEGIEYRHILPGSLPVMKLPFDKSVQFSTDLYAVEMQKIRPEILHVGSGHRGYETALVGEALSRWADIPWVYEVRSFFETTWTADSRYMENSDYFERRLKTESWAMAKADLVITLSGPMRDEIINVHGIDPERVVQLPNAVDITRFEKAEPNLELKKKLGLDGSFVLGYVSNLDHFREGQEVLIEGVAKLRKRGINASLLLVGEGRRRKELEALAKKLGLGAAAVFTGNVPFDEVDSYYSLIDLFVVPRVDERAGRLVSPMKPFEAMAMEVPIMVSDLPALVEIAQDGRCAVFKHENPQDLADVAQDLIENPAKMTALVDAAKVWVKTERTWDVNARTLAQAYELAHQNFLARRKAGTNVG